MTMSLKSRLAGTAIAAAALVVSTVASASASATASQPLTFGPTVAATSGSSTPGDVTLGFTGAGCGAVGCTTAGVPATATWSLAVKDSRTNASQVVATGTGNTVSGTHEKVITVPPAPDFGRWIPTLTFANGSGTTRQTWYATGTSMNYGTPASAPAAPTSSTVAPGTAIAAGTTVTVTATGGSVAPGGVWADVFDFGVKGASGNIQTVAVSTTSGTPTATASFTYATAGTYTLTVNTTDGQTTTKSTTPDTITIQVQ